MTHQPVWRGVPSKFVRDADYQVNSIGYWPTYSSTTKQEEIALQFSLVGSDAEKGKPREAMVFEIYLNNENSTATNIETDAQWSYYPSEEEVLLFPFFAFQVIGNTKITRDDNTIVRKITMMELPYQDILQIKPLSSCSVIYCSKEAPNSENCSALRNLESECDEIAFVHCQDLERAHMMIKSTV